MLPVWKVSPLRCLRLHMAFSCLCLRRVQTSPFHKDNSHAGLKPNLKAPSLLDPLHRPYFQIGSHSQMLGVRTSTTSFGEMLFNPFSSQRWPASAEPALTLTSSVFLPTVAFGVTLHAKVPERCDVNNSTTRRQLEKFLSPVRLEEGHKCLLVHTIILQVRILRSKERQ